MYTSYPSYILGFHGTDKNITDNIINKKEHLKASKNTYDWLGHGIYFWENDPERALEYAIHIKDNPNKCKEQIDNPDVIGAVIDLGNCLNLMESINLEHLKDGYDLLVEYHKRNNTKLPENKPFGSHNDLLLRYLDCAVIETIHTFNDENNIKPYDSVRAVFWEGKELYKNAGFREKNHIQICIRNLNCIKGYFRPLERTPKTLFT